MKPSCNGGRKTNNLPVFAVVFCLMFFAAFVYIEDVKSMAGFSGIGVTTREVGEKRGRDNYPAQEFIKNGELGSVSMNSRAIVGIREREDDPEESLAMESPKLNFERQGNRENRVQEPIRNGELSAVSKNERDSVGTELEESQRSVSEDHGDPKISVQELSKNGKLSSTAINKSDIAKTELGEDDSEHPVQLSPVSTNERDMETTQLGENDTNQNIAQESSKSNSKKQCSHEKPVQSSSVSTGLESILSREGVELPPRECDLFTGEWVYANVTHPLYKEDECPYLTRQVTCLRNGRKDARFQSWRWQPRDCSLPKFEGRVLMEKLRGKRLMFVGDSLNRNQWESMVCLVQSVSPLGKKSLTKNGSLSVFKMQDYNATVEFYWAPFIVESNSDDPDMHSVTNRIIMPESIDKHGRNWKNADYLVFNTYMWWMNTGTMKVLRGSFDEGSTGYDEIQRPIAYERVLRTWSDWVDENVDPSRTSVFFNSMSPLHIRSSDWGNGQGIKCALETVPIRNMSLKFNVGTDLRMFTIAANMTGSMKVHVDFINITRLSEYRKDAHTGVYTVRQGKILTDDMKADPATYADCIHWCLPGLPDTWNEFLYTSIVSRS